MSLKLNMIIFYPFISLKIEKGATNDGAESIDSLSSSGSNGHNTGVPHGIPSKKVFLVRNMRGVSIAA